MQPTLLLSKLTCIFALMAWLTLQAGLWSGQSFRWHSFL
jgi:hypothetical protein